MLLAIDTSTETASIAIVQDSAVQAEITWRCEQSHTTQLLPNLEHLLKQTGQDIQSITGIIVAIGPGSYNGLRVGLSTAKGLAYSLSVPIIGISSLETEAYKYAETGLPICPVFNAGRGEVASALYQRKRNVWKQVSDERITTVQSLCSEITGKTLFCGEYVTLIASQIKEILGYKAVIPSGMTDLRRASFLAALGSKKLADGGSDDLATLQPVYLRRPAITRSKHF